MEHRLEKIKLYTTSNKHKRQTFIRGSRMCLFEKRCRQARPTEQMKIIEETYFYFFCQRTGKQFLSTLKWYIWFFQCTSQRKKPKEPFFANALNKNE